MHNYILYQIFGFLVEFDVVAFSDETRKDNTKRLEYLAQH